MPTITTKYKPARELQERLVQCCLDYIRETHNKEIQRVVFTADMLQESARYGSWQACTDSTCELEGLDNEDGFYEIDFSA
jgi:hypothetical protein